MRTIKFFVFVNIILLFNACDQPQSDYNSKQKKIIVNDNESWDSIKCEFTPQYSNDTLPVSFCSHYLYGKLIRDGLFVNEKTPLSYHYFYDSKSNVIKIKEFSLITKDSSVLNNFIELNSDGDTLYTKSNFYKINLLNDTLFTGQPIDIEVVLIPYYMTSKAEVEIEELTNSDSIWIAPLNSKNNFKTNLKLKPISKAGRYVINGRIREVNKDVNGNFDGDSIVRDLNVTHFISIIESGNRNSRDKSE